MPLDQVDSEIELNKFELNNFLFLNSKFDKAIKTNDD